MKNIPRFAFDAFLFAAVFYAPWWLVVILAIAGVFFFSEYREVVAAGVLYDILYGVTGFGIVGLGGIMGLASSVALLILGERIKKELRA